MNKKIKLSLLGTLIAGSALAVTLPIVSCSASADVALTSTVATDVDATATTAMTTFVAAADDFAAQEAILAKGNKITSTDSVFAALAGAYSFAQTEDATVTHTGSDVIESFEVTTAVAVATGTAIPAGTILTVNLKSVYTADKTLTITLAGLGDAK